MTESVLTPQQARDLCAYWQKVLRIQDWDIEVRIVRAVEFTLPDSAGECHTFSLKRRAIIHLLDPVDWKLGNKGIFSRPPDHEYTLLHELLHVVMCGFTPKQRESPEHDALEQGIDAIADALLKLFRSGVHAIPHVPLDLGAMPVGELPQIAPPPLPQLVVSNPPPPSTTLCETLMPPVNT